MADEVIHLARRVSDIGLKTGLGAHLKIGRYHWFRGTRRVSSLSVGLLLKNTANEKNNGARAESDSPCVFGDTCTGAKSAVRGYDTRKKIKQTLFCDSTLIRRCQIVRGTFLRRSKSQHDLNFSRSYSGNGGYTEPLYKNKSAYYDILGISSSATHAQIKTAYYKQSFAYHPDRNAGSDEATLRFSEINEAYSVLGNKALRKKYDRGLLSFSDLTAGARPSAAKGTPSAGSSQRTTGPRRSVMDQEESARMFDFDKFFKSHYGEQLQRERDIRLRREQLQKKKEESIGEQKLDRTLELGVGLMLVVAVGLIMSLKRN